MLQDYFETFIMQNWASKPDGMGGIIWENTDGAPFKAGISTNSSDEMQIAYKGGLKTIYTIVHDTNLSLELDDRVKRLKDGKIYRITSNSTDMTTPDISNVKFSQVTAEVIDI